MAHSGGFEPPTARFVAEYSIQLSYECVGSIKLSYYSLGYKFSQLSGFLVYKNYIRLIIILVDKLVGFSLLLSSVCSL